MVTLQVGKTVWDQAPRQMRVELWMSSLQRRGVGVAAAAKYEDMLLTVRCWLLKFRHMRDSVWEWRQQWVLALGGAASVMMATGAARVQGTGSPASCTLWVELWMSSL